MFEAISLTILLILDGLLYKLLGLTTASIHTLPLLYSQRLY